jgi:valyl-tRNA synthetase
MTVAEDGTFISEVRPWSGKFVKDADPFITNDLDGRGLLLKAGTYTHTYPFCWRCTTPLLYYARPTWYIRTSQYKQRLVDLNERLTGTRAYQARALRKLAGEQRRLGVGSRTLLGHPPACVGMRNLPPPGVYWIGRTAVANGWSRSV